MANDRLYLRCPVCKERQLLAKYWGAGDFGDTAQLDGLGAFLTRHTHLCLGWFKMMEAPKGWEITNEGDLPTSDEPTPR